VVVLGYQVDTTTGTTPRRKTNMFEIAWMEFTARGQLVSKRKAFKNEWARDSFTAKLFGKESFYKIIAIR
jgi:hypothetical protein